MCLDLVGTGLVDGRRRVALDPFSGTGTTAVAALQRGWDAVGIDLNPDFNAYARERLLGLSI